MSRVLITGSTDGLGLMAGRLLAEQGHDVTLHARNAARAADARAALPQYEAVVIGDLASIAETRGIAEQANALGRYDAVIHNAGVGYREPRRIETVDGLTHVFAINVLAPYLLTALMTRPDRLVYLSSGMHHGGNRTSATCSGPVAAGEAPRRTPTASCSTSCWPSRSPGAGRACCRMRSTPAGCRRRWAGRAPRTTSISARAPRSGLPSATTRRPSSRAATSTTSVRAGPTPPRTDHAIQDELLARCGDLTGVPFP